jgi:hypothetical protein
MKNFKTWLLYLKQKDCRDSQLFWNSLSNIQNPDITCFRITKSAIYKFNYVHQINKSANY